LAEASHRRSPWQKWSVSIPHGFDIPASWQETGVGQQTPTDGVFVSGRNGAAAAHVVASAIDAAVLRLCFMLGSIPFPALFVAVFSAFFTSR